MNHHNPPNPLFQTDGTQPPSTATFRDPFAEEVTR